MKIFQLACWKGPLEYEMRDGKPIKTWEANYMHCGCY